jgi:hypothetical protein
MSLVHSYVIPYTENSNFDEISVYAALENYLTAEYRISFDIKVGMLPLLCFFVLGSTSADSEGLTRLGGTKPQSSRRIIPSVA